MERKKLPLKTNILFGVSSGLFYSISMALFYYYFNDESFSTGNFIFNFVFFGVLMTFFFRYKGTKKRSSNF